MDFARQPLQALRTEWPVTGSSQRLNSQDGKHERQLLLNHANHHLLRVDIAVSILIDMYGLHSTILILE